MSLAMLLAAGASVSGPSAPVPKTLLFTHEDWTAGAILGQGPVTHIMALVEVSAEGKAVACRVLDSNAEQSMIDQVCPLALKRGNFTPARDANGAPITGVYRHRLVFLNPNIAPGRRKFAPATWAPIVTFEIAQWPAGEARAFEKPITIAAEIASDGRLLACASGKETSSTKLSAMGCEILLRDRPILPTLKQADVTTAYVSEFSIAFQSAPQSDTKPERGD